jgi:hypothetical protein
MTHEDRARLVRVERKVDFLIDQLTQKGLSDVRLRQALARPFDPVGVINDDSCQPGGGRVESQWER